MDNELNQTTIYCMQFPYDLSSPTNSWRVDKRKETWDVFFFDNKISFHYPKETASTVTISIVFNKKFDKTLTMNRDNFW